MFHRVLGTYEQALASDRRGAFYGARRYAARQCVADGLTFGPPCASERLVAVDAESVLRTCARLTIERAPPLRTPAMRGSSRRNGRANGTVAALSHATPGAHAERVLLNELRETSLPTLPNGAMPVPRQRGHADAMRLLHGGANELALVGHRVEERSQLRLDLERYDLLRLGRGFAPNVCKTHSNSVEETARSQERRRENAIISRRASRIRAKRRIRLRRRASTPVRAHRADGTDSSPLRCSAIDAVKSPPARPRCPRPLPPRSRSATRRPIDAERPRREDRHDRIEQQTEADEHVRPRAHAVATRRAIRCSPARSPNRFRAATASSTTTRGTASDSGASDENPRTRVSLRLRVAPPRDAAARTESASSRRPTAASRFKRLFRDARTLFRPRPAAA